MIFSEKIGLLLNSLPIPGLLMLMLLMKNKCIKRNCIDEKINDQPSEYKNKEDKPVILDHRCFTFGSSE